jgi:hypothetical protein
VSRGARQQADEQRMDEGGGGAGWHVWLSPPCVKDSQVPSRYLLAVCWPVHPRAPSEALAHYSHEVRSYDEMSTPGANESWLAAGRHVLDQDVSRPRIRTLGQWHRAK